MGGVRKSAVVATVTALVAIFGGLWLSSRVQAPPGVSVEAVHFTGKSGARMRALLFRPDDATAQAPRPAILAVHGYLNSAEMQGNFATEFARRGYVVLAPDQRGHGSSDPTAFADGFGGPDALAYLRSLPFVDRDNIGLEGHSMGGWTVIAAAAAIPDGYRAMVLEGSAVGAPFAAPGTPQFPRNLLVVFGLRDEFGGLMWGKESPLRTGATEKLMTTFGASRPVEPNQLHGDIAAGTARMLVTPPTTHAWLHESSAGIGPAIDWFAKTLKGGKALPASDQVWQWREAGAAVALIAVPVLLIGLMGIGSGLLRVGGGQEETPADAGGASVAALAGLALVPAVSFIPLAMLAEKALGQNALLRQTFTNQYASWALVSAGLAVLAVRRGKRPAAPLKGGRQAAAIAVLTVAVAHVVVAAADALGHVNPSWWFITVRPLTLSRFRDFIVYLPFFLAFAIAALYALDTVRPLSRGSAARAITVAAATLGGGFVLFLAVQYGVLAATGRLLLAGEGLRTITAIGFVPMFATVGAIGTMSRRWTGSVLTGGVVSGLFVTWVLTATQPIGV